MKTRRMGLLDARGSSLRQQTDDSAPLTPSEATVAQLGRGDHAACGGASVANSPPLHAADELRWPWAAEGGRLAENQSESARHRISNRRGGEGSAVVRRGGVERRGRGELGGGGRTGDSAVRGQNRAADGQRKRQSHAG